uniref:Uncharacterized protein n=1 Tax=Megaselia scalaris TaxID=36166 RepID=T1GME0_MEGSC
MDARILYAVLSKLIPRNIYDNINGRVEIRPSTILRGEFPHANESNNNKSIFRLTLKNPPFLKKGKC